ncbi:MAG: AAA family ATPase [Bacteroidales bacterium]|nr:AAA family ATPase [Bacteroidales bacterium]
MFALSKQQQFLHYTVAFPIREGDYAETYRVKDSEGHNHFLKLIDLERLNGKQFDADGNVIEVNIMQGIDHPCVMHLIEHGETSLGGRQVAYMVSEFISGETLEQRYNRERSSNPYEVRQWMLDVLEGLQYLHQQPDPVIHNELTAQNAMLNAQTNRAIIIDFGHARRMSHGRRTADIKGLNPYYLAPEVLHGGLYSPQSDLFSVGVTAYRLLYGGLPWQAKQGDDFDEQLQAMREQPLRVPSLSNVPAPDGMVEAIAKALSVSPADRFRSADEMARAMRGELHISAPMQKTDRPQRADTPSPTKAKPSAEKKTATPKGNGLKDVVGMRELKAQIQRDVIDVLRNPEESRRYGLSLPNGMLLYGPPGCGKTYFAKKLAEELDFNFMLLTPSDLKSKWVNATQENIAKMFREAEEKAPTIIFIDEINELLPKRNSNVHEMSRSAVNEMLAQMDRTGERGIFLIGATNLPDEIDEAMTRSGRIEKSFYVGPPDAETRREIFEMELKGRPLDFGIDYERLSALTENYVSADIRFIVDEAARDAKDRKAKIDMATLERSIAANPSSLTPKKEHTPIGFKK